jgi:hypothetical protein
MATLNSEIILRLKSACELPRPKGRGFERH